MFTVNFISNRDLGILYNQPSLAFDHYSKFEFNNFTSFDGYRKYD